MTKKTSPKEDFVYQFSASGKFGKPKAKCFSACLSGLYRSDDGGKTWQPAFGSLNLQEPLTAQAVVIPPDFDREPSVFVGLAGGILRSLDGGQNWESAYVPSPPPVISTLAMSPNYDEDGLLFAGTVEDGILSSTDRGRRWNTANFGLLDLNVLCLTLSPDFAKDETIFAGTQSGIFRSTNGGRSWREVNLSIGFQAVLCLTLSPNFATDATLFAGTEHHGLLRSTDGGLTWQRLAKSVLRHPINSILLAPDFHKRPEMLILEGGNPMLSTDGGKSWEIWREEMQAGKDVTAVYAPHGFESTALIGFSDGTILCI